VLKVGRRGFDGFLGRVKPKDFKS